MATSFRGASKTRPGIRQLRREFPGSSFGRPGTTRLADGNAMTPSDIDQTFREEAGRALATLIRLVGDFDLAEDALQDAFAVALERWSAGDLPDNPRAWLVNVARNKAIDRVRRQTAFRGKQQALLHELEFNARCDQDQANE